MAPACAVTCPGGGVHGNLRVANNVAVGKQGVAKAPGMFKKKFLQVVEFTALKHISVAEEDAFKGFFRVVQVVVVIRGGRQLKQACPIFLPCDAP